MSAYTRRSWAKLSTYTYRYLCIRIYLSITNTNGLLTGFLFYTVKLAGRIAKYTYSASVQLLSEPLYIV